VENKKLPGVRIFCDTVANRELHPESEHCAPSGCFYEGQLLTESELLSYADECRREGFAAGTAAEINWTTPRPVDDAFNEWLKERSECQKKS
jgi:hypothetical protein